MRSAACSVVGGLVISFSAVCKVVNRNSDTATLSTVSVSRRLLRNALRTMKPGIDMGSYQRSAISSQLTDQRTQHAFDLAYLIEESLGVSTAEESEIARENQVAFHLAC